MNQANNKPRIALTMGDPAGVGPELVLRAMADPIIYELCHPVVFGDLGVLKRCSQTLGIELPELKHYSKQDWEQADVESLGPSLVEVGSLDSDRLVIGKVSAECGRAAYDYIQAAIDATLLGNLDAVTTAPINKEALRAAGIGYPGHTEMFAERAAADVWCMMQYSEELTCTFATVHVGYHEVPKLLTRQRVLDTIKLTADALLKIRRHTPQLVVCGLNPHAGENGLFGNREEELAIIPAIEEARQLGIHVEGPVPPDTAFLPWKRKAADAVVCMYHDQGHIPIKALAFDSAVNTTLGLKITRTSVDHGTAFDIAWQGQARPNSLFAAIRLAAQLVSFR